MNDCALQLNGDTLSMDFKPRKRRAGVKAPRILHRSSFLVKDRVLVLAHLEVGAEDAGTRVRILDLAAQRKRGRELGDCKFNRDVFLSDLKLLIQPR